MNRQSGNARHQFAQSGPARSHSHLEGDAALIHWLHHSADPLPDTRLALGSGSEAPGLLAAGGELNAERLTEAYSKGVFPWYSAGQPVLWWSPDPRMVLSADAFRLSRSLRKTVRRFAADTRCEIRIDTAFREVITACATAPRDGQNGTWIVPEMIEAYCAWHARGHVHSIETWIDGALVGGLYGVCLGRMFFGESMFARGTDASKIAVAALICFCRAHGIGTIDCQQHTGHLESLGAREVPRAEFEAALSHGLAGPPITDWSYDLQFWRHLETTAQGPSQAGPDPDGIERTQG